MDGLLSAGDSFKVSRDEDGRFSLTDLHRSAVASGRAAVHQRPSAFLAAKRVQAFVSAVSGRDGVDAVRLRDGHAYAVRSVVLRYVSWLDPALEAQVFRYFEAGQSNSLSRMAQRAADNFDSALRIEADDRESFQLASLGAQHMISRRQMLRVIQRRRNALALAMQTRLFEEEASHE